MSNRLDIFNEKLNSNSVLVYLYLERHGARKNQCFHSTKTIASSVNISVRTVNRVLNELEKEGFIIRMHRFRKDGGKTSNLYSIIR